MDISVGCTENRGSVSFGLCCLVTNYIYMALQDIHKALPTEQERTAHRWFIGYSVTLTLSPVWRQKSERASDVRSIDMSIEMKIHHP